MLNIVKVLELTSNYPKLLIALDRDGTLVPYAKHPKDAVMPPSVQMLLDKLASCPDVYVALVSARSIKELKADVGDSKIILAGDYGLEISFPNRQGYIHPAALQAVPELQEISTLLKRRLRGIHGAIMEVHSFSLCLHWHLVPQEEQPAIHEISQSVSKQLNKLQMRALPTSYEFVPNTLWDKSYALEEIERRQSLNPETCLHIYVGDTLSDEPAFLWVNGKGGASIKVGSLEPLSSSCAQIFLTTPQAVADFLTDLSDRRLAANS